jgi:hypothetical protein
MGAPVLGSNNDSFLVWQDISDNAATIVYIRVFLIIIAK